MNSPLTLPLSFVKRRGSVIYLMKNYYFGEEGDFVKKLPVLLIAALLCVPFLTSCSGGGATLTVWCAEMDKEMIVSMVDEFLATKPGVREIVVEVNEDDVTRERFTDDPSAAADVICIPHDQLGALVNRKGLLEITDAKHLEAVGQNIAPSVRAGQIDGKQYGFPSSFETHILFYDKSIISDSAAQTLESILATGVPGDGYGFAMDFGNAYFSANWFFTYGCKLFGDLGDDSAYCDFDNADGIAAMTWLIGNRDEMGDCNDETAIGLFKEHRLGAFVGGPWNAAAVTEALKGHYGCAKLPDVDGKPMRSFAGYKLYCVNANTKNKTTAMELAAWLTKPENQKIRFITRNLIPVAVSLADDADVAASATAKAVIAQGPYAIPMPSIPEMSHFWTPTGDFTSACHSGDIEISALREKLIELTSAIKGASY